MAIARTISIAQKEYLKSNQIYFVRKRETAGCKNQQKSGAAHKGQWSLAATTVTVQTASTKKNLRPPEVYATCTERQHPPKTASLLPKHASNSRKPP